MRTRLEILEAKSGRVHTTKDYDLAQEKAHETPEKLTDLDLAVLEFFGGEHQSAHAHAAREQALHPTVEAPATVATRGKDISEADVVLKDAILALSTFTDQMNERNKERNAKIDALEKKVAELEESTERRIAHVESEAVSYKGVWDEHMQYNRGEFVTCGGSMWHCNASTRSRPGTDGTFTLAVKKGRDAKDAQR